MTSSIPEPGHDVVVVGSVNLDRIFQIRRMPKPGETVFGALHQLGPGGKGGNQAAAVAHLGKSVALVAAVGEDVAAEMVVGELRSAGVDLVALKRDASLPTGEALILLEEGGENSIIVVPGANDGLTLQDLAILEQRSQAPGSAVLIQCEIPMPTVLAALQRTRGRRLRVLNPAPASAVTAAVLAEVDVLVPNRVELSELAEGVVSDIDEAREAMMTLPVSRIVVTMGAQGALVRDAGSFEHVLAPTVQVVDTTGAGDAFCAALTAALVEGRTLLGAAEYAVHAASLSTRVVGAQTGHPSAEDVERFLKSSRPV